MTTDTKPMLTDEQIAQWQRDGYLIVRGMFSAEEVAAITERFQGLADAGEPIPGHWKPDLESDDLFKRYPRLMHPHRFDDFAMRMMLKPEVGGALEQLLGEPARGCQTMFYYKPPGSAGQALHQDNFYLAVDPGVCIAAWTAIDPAEPANGGMYLVPGSHKLDVMCPDPEKFDGKTASNLVDPPKGMKAAPAEMQPGDTLFFGGTVIHGSGRNRTTDRWRRSFISHYVPASATHVNSNYFPIYDFDGREIPYEAAADGGPCGEALGQVANSYGVDAVIH